MDSEHSKKLHVYKLLSLLTILIGATLLTFMIVVEDEPGAVPLALILIGTGWYFFIRSKLRTLQNQS